MIDLIAAATVGAIAGSAIMRRIDLRKMVAAQDNPESVAHWQRMWKHALDTSRDNASAHARLADACLAKQARIDRLKDIASSQQSVKSARIIAVLSGDA